MRTPFIKFLVSSPYGDVPVDADKLDLPLECDSLKTPYRVYFQSIKELLEKDEFAPILGAAAEKCGGDVTMADVKEIIVRTEKHGALYHPASVELSLDRFKVKFGLNVAVSETGRQWLQREFTVIQKIEKKFNLPYLPRVYFFDEQGSISFLLEEWFEGYHEFHLSLMESGKRVIKLWDYSKGYKDLSMEQSFEIYRQASKIMTLYYDVNDFSQIFPWHHAAGDFVARVDEDGLEVRLTTARRYEPYMVFHENEGMNPILALFFFLLNLSIKMRLDKLDGVGNTVWAEDFCLDATLRGVYEALRTKDDLQRHFDSEVELFNMLRSFSIDDLKAAHRPIVDLYARTADYPVIMENLDRHIEALHVTLQDSPL